MRRILAFWAAPRSVKDWYPYFDSLDSLARSRVRISFADQMAVRGEHVRAFREQIPGARVVRLVGARHFLFLTNARQVADGIRPFLASL